MQIQFESNGPHGEMFIPKPATKRQDARVEDDSVDTDEPVEREKPHSDSVQ